VKVSGVLVFVLAVAATPAVAQTNRFEQPTPPPYGAGHRLPPYEAAAIVRSMNMMPLSRPTWDGEYYVLRAMTWRGDLVRVVVDGRRGRVVRVAPVPARRWAGDWRYGRFGALAPYYQDDNPPLPPRGVPMRRPVERMAPTIREGALTPAPPPLRQPDELDRPDDDLGERPSSPPAENGGRIERATPPSQVEEPATARSAPITSSAPPMPRPRPVARAVPRPANALASPSPEVTATVPARRTISTPNAGGDFPPVAPLD
jgi:hypothetical protein